MAPWHVSVLKPWRGKKRGDRWRAGATCRGQLGELPHRGASPVFMEAGAVDHRASVRTGCPKVEGSIGLQHPRMRGVAKESHSSRLGFGSPGQAQNLSQLKCWQRAGTVWRERLCSQPPSCDQLRRSRPTTSPALPARR